MIDKDFTTENSVEEILTKAQDEQAFVNESSMNVIAENVMPLVMQIEESSVPNITVSETSDASLWTRVVANHNASDPNQHTIGAITGLREELDKIQSLKSVYSDGVNVANYYKWNKGTHGEHGCFVSLVANTSEIAVCEGSNILGVSVDIAGFIGGQDAAIPRDDSYGLIVTSGLVDVRCELDVVVGDYIVSNSRGYAKKSGSNYGYKVLAQENKGGVEYAVIALGVQADEIYKLGTNLDDIREQVDANYKNIISAVNTAHQAYQKANEIDVSNKTMSDKVDGALGIVDGLATDVENLSTQVSNSALISAQAKAIAESAATSAESMRNEAVADANQALEDTTRLREELQQQAFDMQTGLENAALQLQSAKEELQGACEDLRESISGVSEEVNEVKKDLTDARDELQNNINEVVDSVDDTKSEINNTKTELNQSIGSVAKEIELLTEDMEPLVSWSDDEKSGVAGFVARADENSVIIADIVTWQDDTNKAVAGFKQEVSKTYATIESVTSLETETSEAIAGFRQEVTETYATIESVTKLEADTSTTIAGVKQEVADTYATIESVTSIETEATSSIAGLKQEVSETYATIEFVTSLETEASEAIAKVIQDVSETYATIESVTQLETDTSNAIAGVKQEASETYATIESVTSLETDTTNSIAGLSQEVSKTYATIESVTSLETETSEAIADVKQQVDANEASINSITSWQGTTDSAIVLVQQKANNNESAIKSLVEWQGTASQSISSINQRVDDTESNISSLTSWKSGAQTSIANVEQKASNNESNIDSLTSWKSGASEAIANVEQKAAANESAIASLTTWQDEASSSIASVTQAANANSSSISLIAAWQSDVENDVSSIASIKTTTDANKASIEELVTKDTELNTTIAGVKTTVDAASASINQITSWQSNVNLEINSISGIKQTADKNSAAIQGLTSWQSDTNTAMARIEQKADANGAYIQSTVANLNKYAVGLHSQAYGFTLEQAASILEEGMMYVPTENTTETYSLAQEAIPWVEEDKDINKVYYTSTTAEDGTVTKTYWHYDYDDGVFKWLESGEIPTITRSFTPTYLYKWGKLRGVGPYRWITVDKFYNDTDVTNTSAPAVYFQTVNAPTIGNNDKFGYWYTNGSALTGTATGYESYTLYKWISGTNAAEDEPQWVVVATLAGNSQSRAVSQIRQAANSITAEVINARGDAASLDVRLTNTESEVQSLASWTKDSEGNQYNLATIKQTADAAGADITLVVQETDEGKAINAASIVAAVNNAGSSVVIDADHIQLDGIVSFVNNKTKALQNNTVYSSKVQYALSSKTDEFEAVNGADGQWSTIAPAWRGNAYMWQRIATIKVVGDYDAIDTWNIKDKDNKIIYYVNDEKKYYYYKNGWNKTDDPDTAGLATETTYSDLTCIHGAAGSSVKQINTYLRTGISENLVQTEYGVAQHEENWWTQEDGKDPYDNSHLNVGDIAYIAGITSDTQLSYMIFGTVKEFTNSGGKAGITLITTHYIMGTKGQDGYTPVLGKDYFNGTDGKDGTSIVWKGTYTSAPSGAQNGWAYYNSTAKASYVYQDGSWYQMSIDGVNGQNGTDGVSVVWKGELSSPPLSPKENWVYKDADDGKVYIYNGSGWELMVLDGSDGADGTNGTDGLSVFITYNDSSTTPNAPTGNGTTDGWHTEATASSIWMSQKVAASANEGSWGTPIKMAGTDGIPPVEIERWQEFAVSDSNTTAPTTGWATLPTGYDKEKGKIYIWTRTVINWDTNNDGKADKKVYGAAQLDTSATTISGWCSANNTTLIDGAKIATGTVTADTIHVSDASGTLFKASTKDSVVSIGAWHVGRYGITSSKQTGRSCGLLTGNYNKYTDLSLINNNQTPIGLYCGADDPSDPKKGTFRVLHDGSLYAQAVKLGTGTIGSSNSIFLSTSDIGGTGDFFEGASTVAADGKVIRSDTAIDNWRLTVGSGFGVTSDGKLYAKGANIEGKIIATENSEIAGWIIGNGCINDGDNLYLYSADQDDGSNVGENELKTWRIKAGDSFGVTSDGKLYASAVNLSSTVDLPDTATDRSPTRTCSLSQKGVYTTYKYASYNGDNITRHILMDGGSIRFYNKQNDENVNRSHGMIYTNDVKNRFTLDAFVGVGQLTGTWYSQSEIINESWRGAKYDIEDLPDKYSVLFDNLRPVRHKYNNGASGRYHTGFILDELKVAMDIAGVDSSELAAYCVDNEEIGEGGIRYSELISLCVNEIQKLKTRVTKLETNLTD